jgi:hypothetical protein
VTMRMVNNQLLSRSVCEPLPQQASRMHYGFSGTASTLVAGDYGSSTSTSTVALQNTVVAAQTWCVLTIFYKCTSWPAQCIAPIVVVHSLLSVRGLSAA